MSQVFDINTGLESANEDDMSVYIEEDVDTIIDKDTTMLNRDLILMRLQDGSLHKKKQMHL